MNNEEFNEPSRGYFYSNYGGGPFPDIATRTDDDIRRAIEQRLSQNSQVTPKDVHFEIDAGVVTLTGEVEHLQVKNAIGNDVCAVPGVWDVKNNLSVKKPQARKSEDKSSEKH